MTYLVHTANAQLAAMWLGSMGWILTAVALGLIKWRAWEVLQSEFITSGLAWVGLWRVCFVSHTVVSPGYQYMYCSSIGITEAFTPPEIAAGQVLMMLSVVVGLMGNAGGIYAMRNVYFGMYKNSAIRLWFLVAGFLCLAAAGMSLVPLLWTLTSVLTNQTIKFPPDFKMPPAPDAQHVGSGVVMGMVGAVLMLVSGINFCRYRLPERLRTSLNQDVDVDVVAAGGVLRSYRGKDNPAFESHEHV